MKAQKAREITEQNSHKRVKRHEKDMKKYRKKINRQVQYCLFIIHKRAKKGYSFAELRDIDTPVSVQLKELGYSFLSPETGHLVTVKW